MRHTRLDQLSDGIFAIVMTLLVFEINIPQISGFVTNEILWTELQHLARPLLSYILAFSLLFTYWRAHHFFVSTYAKNVDLMLANINVLFFMLISLIPFSARFLDAYSNYEISVLVFGTHVILIGLTLYWMRRYVLYSDHIKNPEISHGEIRRSTIRTLAPVIFALIAMIISFISIKFSLVLFTLAVLFNLSSASSRFFEKLFRLQS
jgi:uncharacterized membrane protein